MDRLKGLIRRSDFISKWSGESLPGLACNPPGRFHGLRRHYDSKSVSSLIAINKTEGKAFQSGAIGGMDYSRKGQK
jgi:hypothetical protein